jgi:hypothetical protein
VLARPAPAGPVLLARPEGEPATGLAPPARAAG